MIKSLNNSSEVNFLFIFFLFFNFSIAQSPLLLHFGFRGIFLLPLMFIITIFFYFFLNRKFSTNFLLLILFLLFPAILSALFWIELKIIFLPLWSILSIFILSMCKRNEISLLIDYMSFFFIVLLIGAYISFFLAFSGVSPSFYLFDKFGETNIVSFGFSLTNTIKGNIIRPSGIYDEPGAFSFFICVLVFLRNYFKKNEIITILILVFGFITLSLTHFIFTVIFLFYRYFNFKKLYILFFILSLSFLFIIFSGFYLVFEELLFLRVTDAFYNFSENERSLNFLNAFKILINNPFSIFVGINSICVFEIVKCVSKYDMFCCNPLEPLVSTGLFLSWPYYLILFYLIFQFFLRRSNFIFLGLIILLLQRPVVNSAGYTFVIFLVLFSIKEKFYDTR